MEKTKSFSAEYDFVDYGGLAEVSPISNDKIELMLKSPAGSLPENLRFEIYINHSDRPLYISGDSLVKLSANTFVHTVEELTMNTKYAFEVAVADSERNIKYDKGDVKYGTTFPYKTADFLGASKAQPLPGKEGESSILVSWTPAVTGSSTFRLNDSDPIAYEVSYTESVNGANTLDDDLSKVGKFTIPSSLNSTISYDSEVIVNGLKAGTRYLFRVRAINYGHYLDQRDKSGLNYRYEQNNKIVFASTSNTSLEYGLSSNIITVREESGFDALRSINVDWSQGTGGFSGYRVYVKKICKSCNDPTGCNVNIKSCDLSMSI